MPSKSACVDAHGPSGAGVSASSPQRHGIGGLQSTPALTMRRLRVVLFRGSDDDYLAPRAPLDGRAPRLGKTVKATPSKLTCPLTGASWPPLQPANSGRRGSASRYLRSRRSGQRDPGTAATSSPPNEKWLVAVQVTPTQAYPKSDVRLAGSVPEILCPLRGWITVPAHLLAAYSRQQGSSSCPQGTGWRAPPSMCSAPGQPASALLSCE